MRAAIPLTAHLDFQFTDFNGEQLTPTAPLGPNHNDKGTFFAGSQATLLTLAGWACTTLMAAAAAAKAASGGELSPTHTSPCRRRVYRGSPCPTDLA